MKRECILASVVVPTCNRRDHIVRCLEGLARQTYANFEILVVDDCSADDTPAVLREFAERHPDLSFQALRNEPQAGANPSRNRAIRAARGEIVAFLDDDCVPEPDWLEKLIRGFSSARVAAVTGLVLDPPATNIYELTFKGTHRMSRRGPTRRLAGCNMGVRRELLLEYRLDEDRSEPLRTSSGQPDVTVSGRGDEEGLYQLLRAAGYEQLVEPDAVVLHSHPLSRGAFFRQAFRGGRSAARLVYKFYLPQRFDMLPFMLTYLTLPLVLLHVWLVAIPLFFFAGALGAITYNDLVNKGKTVGEVIRSFPMLVVYYHVRLGGYILESLRLRLTRHDLERIHLNQD